MSECPTTWRPDLSSGVDAKYRELLVKALKWWRVHSAASPHKKLDEEEASDLFEIVTYLEKSKS